MSGFLSTLTPLPSLLIPGPPPDLPGGQGRSEWREVRSEWLSLNSHSFSLAASRSAPNVPILHNVIADADLYDASRTLGKPSSSWNMAIQLTSNDIPSAQTLQALGSFGLSEVRKRTYLACAGFSSVSILRTWGLLLSQG